METPREYLTSTVEKIVFAVEAHRRIRSDFIMATGDVRPLVLPFGPLGIFASLCCTVDDPGFIQLVDDQRNKCSTHTAICRLRDEIQKQTLLDRGIVHHWHRNHYSLRTPGVKLIRGAAFDEVVELLPISIRQQLRRLAS